jgi:hypothetical protein
MQTIDCKEMCGTCAECTLLIWAFHNADYFKMHPYTHEMFRQSQAIQKSRDSVGICQMLTTAMNTRGVPGKVFGYYAQFIWRVDGRRDRTSTMAICSKTLLNILEGRSASEAINEAFGVVENNILMRADGPDLSSERPLRVVRKSEISDGEQLIRWRIGKGLDGLTIEISKIDMATVAALHAYANELERMGGDQRTAAEVRAVAAEFFLYVGPELPSFMG